MDTMKRFWKFQGTEHSLWTDWKWQLRMRLRNAGDVNAYFPDIGKKNFTALADALRRFRFGITPYALSLVELDASGNPLHGDPIWSQLCFHDRNGTAGLSDYDGSRENWEAPEEMRNAILHHKYPDRAILRIVDACFGYCNYCYLTARIIDRAKARDGGSRQQAWDDSLAYLRENPQIRDVLISGGDPLVLTNERLERVFSDLSRIGSVRSLRLNTRALSFNPYRFDRDLVAMFKTYRLTALEIHLAHPREITPVFDEKLGLFEEAGYRPLILWRAPLLRGINDSEDVLKELFLQLYRRRIVPYYLFHYAPYTLGRSRVGVSIRRGIELMQKIRREIPGPAFPRYTLFHIGGKQDIPLEPEGTPSFVFTRDERNNPMVKFLNWKNTWVWYPDIDDGDE